MRAVLLLALVMSGMDGVISQSEQAEEEPKIYTFDLNNKESREGSGTEGSSNTELGNHILNNSLFIKILSNMKGGPTRYMRMRI